MKRLFSLTGMLSLLSGLVFALAVPASAAVPPFDKANFNHPLDITNQYMPLKAGTTFIYEGTADKKATHEEFVVTNETKTILGVTALVIRDSVFEAGKLVERTDDWHAQDNAGNVWYLGEFSTQYKNGKVIGHEGSWEGGVDGAQPGVVMEAHPKVGDTYQQEDAPDIAQDMATVLSLTELICVPYGCFTKVLETKDFSPLDPGVVEHKYFAPGVGQIKEIVVEGGSESYNWLASLPVRTPEMIDRVREGVIKQVPR